MDSQGRENSEEPLTAETPEDVAILYSWANLHGAKYRDFSASRREYRAQVRHRAAEDLRQAELKAQAEAEAAAAEADRAAREAERLARHSDVSDSEYGREQALRLAEESARRAAAERVEAARRAEAAAIPLAAARREEREIAEAHASAQRQAARWADSEIRRRSLAGPQPAPVLVPGLASDPYQVVQGTGPEVDLYTPNTQLEYTQPQRYRGDDLASGERRAYRAAAADADMRRRPQGYRPDEASGYREAYRSEQPAPVRNRINSGPEMPRVVPQPPYAAAPSSRAEALSGSGSGYDDYRPAPGGSQGRPFADARAPEPRRPQVDSAEPVSPAWLYQGQASRPVAAPEVAQQAEPVADDTLQQSRERVAARWYGMKGAFDANRQAAQEPAPESRPVRQREIAAPVLAVFSLAGGVGKTSLVATLGRALSSMGEKVLLADTTSHGLLPFYFGASELRPGVVRTFSPPAGSTDAAIHLVSYDMDAITSGQGGPQGGHDGLVGELARVAGGMGRALLDLNGGASQLLRRLARSNPTVLVPVAPDMNSVISLQAVERFFQGLTDADGRPLQPFYLINQFDAALPLHLDVREVLRRQLGDRLVPYTIRRAPAVSEALAEGMTVVDYAPDSAVAEDYLTVANWVRTVSAPATQPTRNNRWSER